MIITLQKTKNIMLKTLPLVVKVDGISRKVEVDAYDFKRVLRTIESIKVPIKTISIKVKVDGSDSFTKIKIDGEDFRKAIGKAEATNPADND